MYQNHSQQMTQETISKKECRRDQEDNKDGVWETEWTQEGQRDKYFNGCDLILSLTNKWYKNAFPFWYITMAITLPGGLVYLDN